MKEIERREGSSNPPALAGLIMSSYARRGNVGPALLLGCIHQDCLLDAPAIHSAAPKEGVAAERIGIL